MSEVSSLKSAGAILAQTGVFGNPFHGLVIAPSYGGTGTLNHGGPTTKTVNMPFSADCWKYHLAGVPPVERTLDELDTDADAGHLWLSDVVINQTMLYGRGLVAPTFPKPTIVDFVWKDEDGTTWGIGFTSTLTSVVAVGNEIEICITRFGEIGGGPVPPRYITRETGINFSAASISSTFHNVYLSPAQYHLYDVKSDGSGAIVGLCGATNSVFSSPFSRRVLVPVGFIELNVSLGVDGWPDVAVTTLADTLTTLGGVDASETYASDTTYESFFVPPSTTYEIATASFVNYTTTKTLSGKIVSMFYQDDTPASVTISTSEVFTYAMTGSATVTAVSGGYNVAAVQTITQKLVTSVTASYAGAEIYNYFKDGPPTVTTSTKSGSITGTGGYPENDNGYGEGVLNSSYYDANTRDSRLILGELNLSPPNTSYGPILHRYTKKVWGAIWEEAGNLAFGQVGTPAGLVSGGAPVPLSGSPPVYRSFDPITNQLSGRYSTPVCYV